MKIAIIDYGAGNIQSILFAIERIGFSKLLKQQQPSGGFQWGLFQRSKMPSLKFDISGITVHHPWLLIFPPSSHQWNKSRRFIVTARSRFKKSRTKGGNYSKVVIGPDTHCVVMIFTKTLGNLFITIPIRRWQDICHS